MVVISACESELDTLGALQESSVSFSVATASIAEATVVSSADKTDAKVGSTYAVTVVRNTSNIAEDLTVGFTLTSQFLTDSDFAGAGDDASETFGVDLEGASGAYSVVIPAGRSSVQFEIRSKDDLFSSGNKELVLTLTSAGSAKLGLGSSDIGKTLKLTIVDDDCPIAIANWVGTYTVEEKFTAGPNAPLGLSDFFAESYQVQFALDPNDATGTKVVITNSPGFDTYINNGTVMTFVTCTKQVTFDPSPVQLALFANITITGTSYSDSQFKVTVSGPLANFGAYEFVLTKQIN